MRLYHPAIIAVFVIFNLLVSCSPPQSTQPVITVKILVDGMTIDITIPAGSNVQRALDNADISVAPLDVVDPLVYSILSNNDEIKIIRVREDFSVEQETVPYEKQILQTESLSDQEQLLAQSGVTGKREITYRYLYHDSILVTKDPVKSVVIQEAIPEIVMVGVQTPFSPVEIPGRIVYLMGGNAWLMEETTANRRPVINTGDMDGRIFSISEDGTWLLLTRRSDEEEIINTLWAASLETDPPQLFDLGVENVIHFADWVPGSKNNRVAFSTVEPRATAPGWQANNDLNILTFSTSGWVSQWEEIIEPNAGGIYGWWGANFLWGPDGEEMAFARPDGVGLVDFENNTFNPLMEITPLQTGADWAWVPGINWSPDGKTLFTVNHLPQDGSESPEESPVFDLSAIPIADGIPIDITPQTGMFAYPTASQNRITNNGEEAHEIAYLQAVFPMQSDNSRYRLTVMDRDASNPVVLFPDQGEQGIDPQHVIWSPVPIGESKDFLIAVIHQGNIWLIDSSNQLPPVQVTGDALINRLDWQLIDS